MVPGRFQHGVWLPIPRFSFEWSFTNPVNQILCSPPGSLWLWDLPSTPRNQFLADLSTAESAVQRSVVQRTNEKQTLAWRRYQLYLQSIGVSNDPYLENFSQGQRHRILGAFAAALRQGRFSAPRATEIQSDSIRATLDCIAQTYKLADKPDPKLDSDGNTAFFLQRQLRCYHTLDPGKKQQVVVTGSILRQFFKSSISQLI